MYDSYATGPYVSPSGFALSQRPFVWIQLRISPEASAGPQALSAFPFGVVFSTGKLPHGAVPLTIRSAPMTPEYPTSMTFERSTLRPTRKPARKIVAPSRTQTGHRGAPGVPRLRTPIHVERRTTQMSSG